jgi:integrase/recombinase XerD
VSALKVRLYVRIRRPDGRYEFVEPAWNRNRSLRSGYAEVAGKHEHHPEGIYYLRYMRGSKRVRQSVGSQADVATAALRNVELNLKARALGRTVSDESSVSSFPSVTPMCNSLAEAIVDYAREIRQFRSPKTAGECERILARFAQRHPGKLFADITRKDLIGHMAHLKAEGLGDRTIFNHITRVNALLRANGAEKLLRRTDWPRYDEQEVTAYTTEQLASLFQAASLEERELFEFFLGTGFREQEVMYMTWANVDFTTKVISIWSKPEMGFRVKDKEERSVPVPDSLIYSLEARKRQKDSTLIFPTKQNNPDGHFLRRLKSLAYRAGLNCAECVSKNGKHCRTSPVCSRWGLHKFRKTYATMHSEAGVSAPTIQRWLGHSDLATTLRYLAIADMRSERTRSQVNATFAGLAIGGASHPL